MSRLLKARVRQRSGWQYGSRGSRHKRRVLALVNAHFYWFHVPTEQENYGHGFIAKCRECGARNGDITGISGWPRVEMTDAAIGLGLARDMHHSSDCENNLVFEAELAESEVATAPRAPT